jgi:hypothetical protein
MLRTGPVVDPALHSDRALARNGGVADGSWTKSRYYLGGWARVAGLCPLETTSPSRVASCRTRTSARPVWRSDVGTVLRGQRWEAVEDVLRRGERL